MVADGFDWSGDPLTGIGAALTDAINDCGHALDYAETVDMPEIISAVRTAQTVLQRAMRRYLVLKSGLNVV